jgi:peroxiredoxin
MNTRTFIITCCLATLAACGPRGHYQINGTWTGGDGHTVYLLQENDRGDRLPTDSATVTGGAFRLSGRLPVVDRRFISAGTATGDVFLDGTPVTVTVTSKLARDSAHQLQSLAIVAGREQALLDEARRFETGKGFVGLGSMLMMMEAKDDSLKLDSIYRVTEHLKQEFDKSLRAFLDTTGDSHAITYFISDFMAREYPYPDLEYYYDRLTPEVKAGHPGKLLRARLDKLRGVNVGGTAPDFKLPAPDGAELSLASLRGKYVILDFWASWCGPCLAEVPNVKAIYDRHHASGLEILGVSLDDKRDKWLDAIAKHGLNWLHVSSLAGWNCPVAKLYNVTGIPKMFLLDKDGRVLATDLRGEELASRVASLFE